jgi:DNA replication protein DnaC
MEQTIEKLKSLHLHAFAESLRQRLARGDHRKMDPEEFISLLIDDEVETRATKKIQSLIRKANLRPEKACLENIRHEKGRGFAKTDLDRFFREDWITRGENMVFTGATGTGKSYLAEALLFQACKLGYRAEKFSLDMLFEEIRTHRAIGQYPKFMKNIERIAVLVIDDFAIVDYSKQQYCELLHLLEERIGSCSTIITSQYPASKWHERIPDPTVADAICDRLLMGALILEMKGPSQRGKT